MESPPPSAPSSNRAQGYRALAALVLAKAADMDIEHRPTALEIAATWERMAQLYDHMKWAHEESPP